MTNIAHKNIGQLATARWPNLGLRGEFVLQFLLISLIPLLVASAIAYTYGKQALEKTIGKGLVQVAQGKLDQADQSITLRLDTIEKYIKTIQTKVALSNGNRNDSLTTNLPTELQLLESNNLLRDDVKQLEGYAGPNSQIIITNATKQIIQSSNQDILYSSVLDEWWEKAYNNNLGYDVIGDIVLEREQYQLTIALPIRDEKQDNVIGILKATLVLPELVDLVKNSNYRQGDELSVLQTVIIDQYGRVVAASNSSEYEFGERIDQSDAAMAAIIASQSEYKEEKWYDYHMRAEKANTPTRDSKELTDTRELAQVYGWARSRVWHQRWHNRKTRPNFSRWTVLVSQPAVVAFEGITDLTQRILNFTMISCAIIIPIAWLLSQRIVTPIMQVVSGVRAVGQGEFDQEIPVTTGNELGLLAEEFNAMERNLKSAVGNLRQEEQKMTAIVNSLSEGLIVVDSQYRVLHINPTAERLLNVHSSALNQDLAAIIKDKNLIKVLLQGAKRTTTENLNQTHHLQKRQTSDSPITDVVTTEITLGRDKNKKENEGEVIRTESDQKEKQIILRVVTVPYLDEEGKILGSVYVFENVTREREIDQMKSDFISLVSHELRTPLTSIIGFVSFVLDGKAGDLNSKQKDSLLRVHRQSKWLADLINDLLDVSRIEAGRTEFERKPVNITRIIKDRVADLRPQAEEKSIQLILDDGIQLPTIYGDEARLGQVLTNLIGNAIKFTPDGGVIRVRANIKAVKSNNLPSLHIEVIDNGVGIPLDEREKVFDKFYQQSNIHTRQQGGTGLGLAIAKSIISAHHGRLWMDDGEGGQGSNFQFTLPL